MSQFASLLSILIFSFTSFFSLSIMEIQGGGETVFAEGTANPVIPPVTTKPTPVVPPVTNKPNSEPSNPEAESKPSNPGNAIGTENPFNTADLGRSGMNINPLKVKSFEEIPGKTIPLLTGVVFMGGTLVFMIGGGFWIFSAGNDSFVERGKSMMTYSAGAMLLVLGAYVIAVLFQTILYALGT